MHLLSQAPTGHLREPWGSFWWGHWVPEKWNDFPKATRQVFEGDENGTLDSGSQVMAVSTFYFLIFYLCYINSILIVENLKTNSQGKTWRIPGLASDALSGEGDERTRGWPAFCVFGNPLTFSEGETSICVLEIWKSCQSRVKSMMSTRKQRTANSLFCSSSSSE